MNFAQKSGLSFKCGLVSLDFSILMKPQHKLNGNTFNAAALSL